MEQNKYRSTLVAGFVGYVVQALVINFAPLLFVTFQREFSLSLAQVSFLVTLTFAVQLAADVTVPRLTRKIGTRLSVVMANAVSALGLIFLGVLPSIRFFRNRIFPRLKR